MLRAPSLLATLAAVFTLLATDTRARELPSGEYRAHCLGFVLDDIAGANGDAVPASRPHPGVFEATGSKEADGNAPILLDAESQRRTGINSIALGQSVGKGGQGAVFASELTRESGATEPVVAKVVRDGEASNESTGYNQYLVARDTAALRPGGSKRLSYIVPILGKVKWLSKTTRQMVTTLISARGGENLRRQQKSLKFPAPSFWKKKLTKEFSAVIRRNALLAHDLLEAVGELSSAGVVHRDLKPENIVTYGGDVNDMSEIDQGLSRFAVIDLGHARSAGAKKIKLAGTVGYIDPATYRDSYIASSQTDLFALATILAENLTGLNPFHRGSQGPLSHLNYSIPGNPDTSYFKRDAVLTALDQRLAQLKQAQVPEADLKIFSDMRELISIGLEPDLAKRLELSRANDNALLQTSTDDDAVLGVGQVFKDHIRESIQPRNQASGARSPGWFRW